MKFKHLKLSLSILFAFLFIFRLSVFMKLTSIKTEDEAILKKFVRE